eukprot:TRINITY_DN73935_c0_g1_i1.p2 TRINITY_DN73935_c0_g1~~TRINITY_DN73935_c0_g1_i1.p2  ORF type:complete len:146 (-),score=7.76 TRINITY_DN73935_c0_g1_i1:131-568(-)
MAEVHADEDQHDQREDDRDDKHEAALAAGRERRRFLLRFHAGDTSERGFRFRAPLQSCAGMNSVFFCAGRPTGWKYAMARTPIRPFRRTISREQPSSGEFWGKSLSPRRASTPASSGRAGSAGAASGLKPPFGVETKPGPPFRLK